MHNSCMNLPLQVLFFYILINLLMVHEPEFKKPLFSYRPCSFRCGGISLNPTSLCMLIKWKCLVEAWSPRFLMMASKLISLPRFSNSIIGPTWYATYVYPFYQLLDYPASRWYRDWNHSPEDPFVPVWWLHDAGTSTTRIGNRLFL